MPKGTAPIIRRPLLRLNPVTGSLLERVFEVRVLSGESKGRVARIEGPMVIGSGRGATLRLDEETVSRKHAELTLDRGNVVVRDLGSTNGLFLGTTRINQAIVEEEAVLSLGQCQIRISLVEHDLGKPHAAAEFGALVGKSPAMLQLFGLLTRVAPSESTVLLRGETGTGKDVVAASIHQRSHRNAKPFVVVDCGALAAGLVESELFGHTRSAFTGADRDRVGALERADGGTLFLDEVGELPLALQPKLLRFLQSSEVQPVGGSNRKVVDVRVIAATHQPLKPPSFREDLYYRLAVLEVTVPPLRDRAGDVTLLARAFARRSHPQLELPAAFLDTLVNHAWPGNVRELQNVVRRTLALFPTQSSLESARYDPVEAELFSRPSLKGTGEDGQERAQLVAALERCGGNQRQAAQLLGVARGTLISRMGRYGLRRPRKVTPC